MLLDAKAVHTGRTARDHLRAMAATHGIPASRVDEVIDLAGIGSVARKRAGKFSLGMGQRLGIASALLGDPHTLILDEPVNGLDPEGVRWVRQFVRHAASEGRTVLLSSHLMSEMAQTADHVIVMGRGQVLADAPLDELVRAWTTNTVRVRTPRAADLAAAVGGTDVEIVTLGARPARHRRAAGFAHRRPRSSARHPAARTHPDHRIARRRLPRPDRRLRRVPDQGDLMTIQAAPLTRTRTRLRVGTAAHLRPCTPRRMDQALDAALDLVVDRRRRRCSRSASPC